MPCYQAPATDNGARGEFGQATARSEHVGGVFAGYADGSVRFVSDDIETTGALGGCCAAWDHLIGSADANSPEVSRPGAADDRDKRG